MKWIVVLALIGLAFIAYFGAPDVDLDSSVFTLDFDTVAMTEQLRIRETAETQRLLIRETAETQRQRDMLAVMQIIVMIGGFAIIALVAYKLLRLLIEQRAGDAPKPAASYALAAPQHMPDDVRARFIIVLSDYGSGYADVDDGEWVFVQPETKTLVPLGQARQLPGPATRC